MESTEELESMCSQGRGTALEVAIKLVDAETMAYAHE
jgi:hypothetical protein